MNESQKGRLGKAETQALRNIESTFSSLESCQMEPHLLPKEGKTSGTGGKSFGIFNDFLEKEFW